VRPIKNFGWFQLKADSPIIEAIINNAIKVKPFLFFISYSSSVNFLILNKEKVSLAIFIRNTISNLFKRVYIPFFYGLISPFTVFL